MNKETSKVKKIINEIIKIKKEAGIGSETNRYIDKKVREELKLQVPKTPKGLPKYLTASELYTLLNTAFSINKKDSALLEFMALTGLRVSEVVNLQINNIDENSNQLLVVGGKGNKDRYVPISNSLIQKIEMWIQGKRTGYVFCKGNGKPYTIRAIQKKVVKYLELCRFDKKNLSTHTLRHTFACLCLAKGLRLEDIQLMMGHSSRVTTEIYARLELGDIKDKYLQLMGGLDTKKTY